MKCYYEELELCSTASNEEIVKAYKKFALKYHPDKNVGNTETAKNKFLEIQKAYQVLSDPHERAWYDRNKDTIELEELSGNFVNPSSFHNTYAFKNYDDGPNGFYTVYRTLFQTIVNEELLFDKTKTEADYRDFGNSDSDFETVVKPFYLKWFMFQTKKSFSWIDEISESKGMNRQELRYINKINSKNRTLHAKQYNESVRSLVLFLKKRDKRIPKKPPVPIPKPLIQSTPPPSVHRPPIDIDWQAHYQNILGDLDEIDNQIDEFTVNPHKHKNNNDFEGIDDEAMKALLEQHSGFVFTDESDESLVRFIKCILCDKEFKTLASFLSHIKSKKHISNVKACERAKKRQQYMDNNFFTPPTSEVDEITIEIDQINVVNDTNGHTYHEEDRIEVDESYLSEKMEKDEEMVESFENLKINKPDLSENVQSDDLEKDQIITKEDVNKSKRKRKTKKQSSQIVPPKKTTVNHTKHTQANVSLDDNESGDNVKEFECQICAQKFLSNTKLFKHIKEKGHAALRYDTPKTKKKTKKQ